MLDFAGGQSHRAAKRHTEHSNMTDLDGIAAILLLCLGEIPVAAHASAQGQIRNIRHVHAARMIEICE